jgi:hypothetical protein
MLVKKEDGTFAVARKPPRRDDDLPEVVMQAMYEARNCW